MRIAHLLTIIIAIGTTELLSSAAPACAAPQHIIIDTDIGGDIDDAFALSIALQSPDIKVDLISVSYGETAIKARLVERLLSIVGHSDVPLAIGPATVNRDGFVLEPWAKAGAPPTLRAAPDATRAMIDLLRHAPAHTLTLVALAPLTTIEKAIDQDPAAFSRLKKVVLMGGSIYRGYGNVAGTTSAAPTLETNAHLDPGGLKKLLASGVDVEMMPLDATEVELAPAMRSAIFSARTPYAKPLRDLYAYWLAGSRYGSDPVLFDAVPVVRLLHPDVCKPVPMHIDVSDAGDTVPGDGKPNASVCLSVNKKIVFDVLSAFLRDNNQHKP